LRQVVEEEIAFQAREDSASTVAPRQPRLPITTLESVVSNAEQRATRVNEKSSFARVDRHLRRTACINGKLELEYEGELKAPTPSPRELIRTAVVPRLQQALSEVNFQRSSSGLNWAAS